jgi:hypothetical protein
MPDSHSDSILETTERLRRTVSHITTEEFRWQDSHYNRDSRYGRELLFLISNSEWIRATSEVIDITRSDSVDTTIKIDVDIDQITHEAFHVSTPRIWLPLLVLPVPKDPEQAAEGQRASDGGLPRSRGSAQSGGRPERFGEPDPFTTLTVTDATGDLLATVPHVDVRHWISAAMAEIIVNMAVARWTGSSQQRPAATRDQRLLLSAGIYRILRSGPADPSVADSPPADPQASQGPAAIPRADPQVLQAPGTALRLSKRISNAKARLGTLLDNYIEDYRHRSGDYVLTKRAIQVLQAFAQATVVVVAVDRERTPTILTVRVPTRRLAKNRVLALGRPRAKLRIDLLLPSGDADRQIQVNLPDGVSFDVSKTAEIPADMSIEVGPPQLLEQFSTLMRHLLGPGIGKMLAPVRQCLADLATVKAEAVSETLRQYLITSPTSDFHAATHEARGKLDQLSTALGQLSDAPDNENVMHTVRGLWDNGHWLRGPLRRRTSADTLSPRAVVARAGVIEDVSQRATASGAWIDLRISVTDAEFFSVARLAGVLSALLMTVVLAFLAITTAWRTKYDAGPPSPEVLAGALTLFSAIQAGRIEHQDRATLRGLLSAPGNWLIVASILPTVVLAIALAFGLTGWTPVAEAAVAIGTQLLFQFAMWRGPLSSTGMSRRSPRRQLWTSPAPDYARSGVLQSDWWRSTTADALKIGRQAHAYMVWEHDGTPSLPRLLVDAWQANQPAPTTTATRRLLSRLGLQPRGVLAFPQAAWANHPRTDNPDNVPSDPGQADGSEAGHAALAERPANILALLRSGTPAQALTFVVFREEPAREWARGASPYPVALDPDRLAPQEDVPDFAEILLSVPRTGKAPIIANHPLVTALAAAAEHRLLVLDAQVPVPPPSAAHAERIWARLRVAARDVEIRQLPSFLDDIRQRVPRIAGHPECDIWVQAAPERNVRIILSSALPPPATRALQVLAKDMDVISAYTADDEQRTDAADWRVLALCANARAGVESEILHDLSDQQPELRLAGLTYAVLHGTAVILMLGHQPGDHTGPGSNLTCLAQRHSADNLAVLVDQWQTQQALGTPGPDPLLRVHIHAKDQPGTLLDIIKALHDTLREAIPALPQKDNDIWHLLMQGTTIHNARMTVRLAVDPREITDWDSSKFGEIERAIRRRAIRAGALRRSASPLDGRLGTSEDTVISVSRICAGAEAPYPQAHQDGEARLGGR